MKKQTSEKELLNESLNFPIFAGIQDISLSRSQKEGNEYGTGDPSDNDPSDSDNQVSDIFGKEPSIHKFSVVQLIEDEQDPLPDQKVKMQKKTFSAKKRKKRLRPVKKIKKRKKTKKTKKNNSEGSSKNIPKNFGKQIINFILKNRDITEKVLKYQFSLFDEMSAYLKSKINSVTNLSKLKSLWIEGLFSKEIRTLSFYFLQKEAIPWIWNSRVQSQNRKIHIEKIRILVKGVMNPHEFSTLKND